MKVLFVAIVFHVFVTCVNCSVKQLDPHNDEILYKIDFLGEITDDKDVLAGIPDGDVIIHTNNKESYRCEVPHIDKKMSDIEDDSAKEHLTPDILLGDIFISNDCVYLVEGYWSYELCHGLHLRQFHEDRGQDGKVINVMEFMLGKQNNEDFPPKGVFPPPTWQYNGIEYPYYEVQFFDGTRCDIRDVGRSIKLAYICDEDHSTVPSLVLVKESITCEYEALVLTNQLCLNEAYRLQEKPVHSIKCYATNGSPSVPKGHELYDTKPVESPLLTTTSQSSDPNRSLRPESPPRSISLDASFMESFLKAEYCLQGRSTGWWQQELCFGEHVKQVHLENDVTKQNVVLGYWNEELHKEWFAKAGKSKRSQNHVMHLYGDGDICDVTSSPRKVRVKFRCVHDSKSDVKISLYLEEPTPCNYILTVEAGFICHLLETAGEHGLFHYNT